MAYDVKNNSQLATIPPNIIVKRAFALDTKRHLGLFNRYPGLLALPDRWATWAISAIPAGLKLINRYKPEVIWSTFPLATAHLVGLSLNQISKTPWVADFRDPMLQIGYPSSRLQRAVYRSIETQSIKRCNAAIFTTNGAMMSAKSRTAKFHHGKFGVIENGYDEESFVEAEAALPQIDRNARFTLLHSGVLYDEGRNPSNLFQALLLLRREGFLTQDTFQLRLRATGNREHFEKLANKHGVGDIVDVRDHIPYREALLEMLCVDALLVIQGKNFNTQVPAKLYEYFRARKPLLALTDSDSETAFALNSAGFHDIASLEDVRNIAETLKNFMTTAKNGDCYIAADEVVEHSSRRHRAAQLASIFNQVSW